jgi:2',3'-cyclic-nucleotide 2'-phosphodiesterase (5'-nucleotidase family)
MKLSTYILFSLLIGCAALSALPLSIFYTGDTHGAYETGFDEASGESQGGYLVLEEMLGRQSENKKRGIYLDSGDQQTGSIFASLVDGGVHGGAVVEVFNRLGLEASVFGNHEFDFSYTNTRDLARRAEYPFVCTNLLDKSTRQSVSGTPYTVIERDGIRAGIFGITLELLPEKVKAENVSSVRILPPADAINMYLDEVDLKSDLIVVLSHQGFEADSLLAVSLDGRVDVIIGGHDHILAEQPIKVNGKYLLYSGSHLNYLGVADIDVVDDKVVSIRNELVPLATGTKEFHTPLAEYIDGRMSLIEKDMRRVVGNIPEAWVPDKYKSTALSRWIAGALKAEYNDLYHPDVAIINNGGLRKSIPAGAVTLRDLHELLPFNNTVTIFSCWGRDLMALDEFNALQSVEQPHDICEIAGLDYPTDIIKGDSYYDEADLPWRNRYTVNGEKLILDKVYRVVSHDYVAGQWDKYLGFKPFDIYDTGELILDAIIRQVEKQYGPRDEEGRD